MRHDRIKITFYYLETR